MDELRDFLEEHGTAVGMGLFALAGVVLVVGFYGNDIKKSQDANSVINTTTEYQRKAERVYFMEDDMGSYAVGVTDPTTGQPVVDTKTGKPVRRGCSAQVLDRETMTASLINGKVVIDPLSVTDDNPQGSPFNGGFVCGSDGSVFNVEPGGKINLIGTSSRVRDDLIATKAIASAREMERYAKSIYDRATQNHANNPQPPALVNPIIAPSPTAPDILPYEPSRTAPIGN